jgi:hypothetical protein
MKIKSLCMFSFMKIQFYNKIKKINYRIPLLNCFNIRNFQRKNIINSYFRRYKNIVESMKLGEMKKIYSNFNSKI